MDTKKADSGTTSQACGNARVSGAGNCSIPIKWATSEALEKRQSCQDMNELVENLALESHVRLVIGNQPEDAATNQQDINRRYENQSTNNHPLKCQAQSIDYHRECIQRQKLPRRQHLNQDHKKVNESNSKTTHKPTLKTLTTNKKTKLVNYSPLVVMKAGFEVPLTRTSSGSITPETIMTPYSVAGYSFYAIKHRDENLIYMDSPAKSTQSPTPPPSIQEEVSPVNGSKSDVPVTPLSPEHYQDAGLPPSPILTSLSIASRTLTHPLKVWFYTLLHLPGQVPASSMHWIVKYMLTLE